MNWFRRKLKTKSVDAVVEVDGPVLKVLVDKSHVASVYKEGLDYCLVYKPAFEASGLLPFNPNEIPRGSHPQVEHVYRSKDLWQVFQARIPSRSRDDYRKLLANMGLSGDEEPLIILGKVGKVSIAKRWNLELETTRHK